MSVFGFGVFAGTLIAAVIVIPKAFKNAGGISTILIGVGFVAWMVTPAVISGILGFAISCILVPIVLSLCFNKYRIAYQGELENDRKLLDLERKNREEARKEIDRIVNAWPLEQKGWGKFARGRMMHLKGQPKCFVMLSDNRALIRFTEYSDESKFQIIQNISISTKSIISMNVASPTISKTRSKTVPVTSIEQERRSPVARGLVGGALLGPAGLIVGAASGLNGKVSSSVTHEVVSEIYDTQGDPQLIIGTSSADHPVFKIKFDPAGVADEWMFRIRGAQV